jgi:type I restriction enzyme R subunit
LFVNGIPLVVIECKPPTLPNHKDPVKEAISQQIRNQRDDEIYGLFLYSQILLALSSNAVEYGTTATPAKFWSVWKEQASVEQEVEHVVNTPLSAEKRNILFSGVFAQCRQYFDQLESQGNRQITEQDQALYCLCRPERLMELMYRFLVYDAGEKKIARYQQYFAVKNTLERVKTYDKDGRRQGGVIWHTQGSGKDHNVYAGEGFGNGAFYQESSHRRGDRPGESREQYMIHSIIVVKSRFGHVLVTSDRSDRRAERSDYYPSD